MKVDFIIVGAQKCATTTLFRILTQHPAIVGAQPKEPHFFSTTPDWRRELPRYEALFDEQPGALYCEASTSYTFYPHRNLEIWNDLFEYNPDLRFIYLVRDPVERIVSSYMHNVARGYTDQGIEELVLNHPLLLNATRYYTQIIPYIRRFGRDRVMIVDFQDFMTHRRGVLRKITQFLDVDMERLGEFEEVHANKSVGGHKRHHRFDNPPVVLDGMRRLLPGVWKRMVNRYSPSVHEPPRVSPSFEHMIVRVLELEIRALEDLMGKDLGHWRRDGAAGSNDSMAGAGLAEAVR